jgi:hypothetical protein
MALRAVEGIPNAMDMDFSGVDPDPTSLDLGAEGDGFATDEMWPNHQRRVDECIVCGRRPSNKPVVRLKSFLYQAASWKMPRQVVAKVEFHFGELFPRVGFIVTNPEADSRAVVRFYKRGTAEQWIKEGKQAVKMTRLSCHRFRSNEVRLWLSVISYNLGNLWRRLVLPQRIGSWSLTSLQQRRVKTGGRLVKHTRY